MLSASELTSRIDIETPTPTNIHGVVTESWASTETGVPASITPRNAMTFTQAAQVQAKTTHIVKIRYRDDITSRTRFKIGSRVFHIVGPPMRDPEDRPTALIFEAIEAE